MRKAMCGQEGADRSGGPCTVKRAPTCHERAERRGRRSGVRCTVRRTLYSEEGADRSGGRRAAREALQYDGEGADRSGGRRQVCDSEGRRQIRRTMYGDVHEGADWSARRERNV